MMQNWSADHIRFMEDAAAYSTFYQSLAGILLPYLPQDGHLCDVGCGLGHLSLALAPYIRTITACDIAQAPIEWLKVRTPENIRVRQCDIFATPPAVPYDAMVICMFGHTQQILPLVKNQCRGSVAVIQRADATHYFTAKPTAHDRHTADLEALLKSHQTPYVKRSFTLEFGQPLRSREDAQLFFQLYSMDTPIPEDKIEKLLQPITHPDFSHYLPLKRNFRLIVFDSQNL